MPLTRYLLLALVVAGPAAATPPLLSAVTGHNVVAMMFAPGADDPQFDQQASELAKLSTQPAFRSLTVVGVAGGTVMGASDTASALRARFGVAPKSFRFIILGLDGQVALSQGSVASEDRIAQAIKATPQQ
jgi:Domain of unknown function (DUF4174)